jgi:hypothetical protein
MADPVVHFIGAAHDHHGEFIGAAIDAAEGRAPRDPAHPALRTRPVVTKLVATRRRP